MYDFTMLLCYHGMEMIITRDCAGAEVGEAIGHGGPGCTFSLACAGQEPYSCLDRWSRVNIPNT